MFLRNLKLVSKLWVLIGIALLFLAGTGVVNAVYTNQMSADSQEMYDDRLIPIQMTDQILLNSRASDTYLVELNFQTDSAQADKLIETIQNLSKSNDQLLQQYKASQLLPEEAKLLTTYDSQVTAFRANRNLYLQKIQAGDKGAYQFFLEQLRPQRESLNSTLEALKALNVKSAEDLHQKSSDDAAASSRYSLALLVTALVLLAVIGFMIARSVTKPIHSLQALMAKAREGDLTVQGTYRSKDEIGLLTTDFNEMMSGFKHVVLTLQETSVTLASSAEQLTATTNQTSISTQEITNAIQDMSQGAEVQMRGAEETNLTMRQMSEGLQRVAESANLATESSAVATRESESGTAAVHNAVEQMTSIKQTVGTSAVLVQELTERSQEVGQVVEVITEIANQVNLLALNAAIEAARAGEHGKGFSVVADEVRQLAEQSREAATSIHSIIEQMQHNTDQAVVAMQAGTEEVEKGMQAVSQAGESFARILSMTQEVAMQIEEVSASVEEMSAGSEEISSSVDYMADIANQSAQNSQMVVAASQEQLASIEEVASSTEQLSHLAVELQSMIAKFKV
ncbi:methyl-accepting chemotaxis protein [Tumebacillus flagellatus]|uniref:Chemotaxis protein n=1 Tax=Tumebacillus flagellatus TaxID=1157490 RepID=A0A074LV19_9BACL|nr:methyl-accepting chemotaxis protein [Tumebacillus flagellatus]KEO84799.1 hypothetical protein EL26_01960 [Tumebacillus flagellatus]